MKKAKHIPDSGKGKTGVRVTDAGSHPEERAAAFQQLIKGEYKDLYDQRMQETIRKRLKSAEESLGKYRALDPVIRRLAERYGLPVENLDGEALCKAVEADAAFFSPDSHEESKEKTTEGARNASIVAKDAKAANKGLKGPKITDKADAANAPAMSAAIPTLHANAPAMSATAPAIPTIDPAEGIAEQPAQRSIGKMMSSAGSMGAISGKQQPTPEEDKDVSVKPPVQPMEKQRLQPSELYRRKQLDQRYQALEQQAEDTRKLYPEFELQGELQNPRFRQLVQNGVDVCTAYEVLHKDELISAAVEQAAQSVEEKLTNRILAGSRRPTENGANGQSAALIKSDVSQLTKADRKNIIRRVQQGERIKF